MTCKYPDREEVILKYLSRELSDAEVKSFHEHIFHCDTCFQEMKLKRKIINVIREEGDVLFPDVLKARRPKAPKPSPPKRIIADWYRTKLTWVYAIIFLVIAAAGALAYWVAENLRDRDFVAELNYDHNVPVVFEPSSLFRSAAPPATDAEKLGIFYEKFMQAMLKYKDLSYTQAIADFEDIYPLAQNLQTNKADTAASTLLREYYFYFGVSHLAISKSQKTELTKAARENNLKSAVKFLEKSNQIAQTRTLPEEDKNQYFLGLAYGLSGKYKLALIQLQMIDSGSNYYDRSLKLIEQWSEAS